MAVFVMLYNSVTYIGNTLGFFNFYVEIGI